MTSFSVATNRRYKDAAGAQQEETEFHNVVAWGRLAEICSEYLNKGRKVYVEGRLRTRDWEAQDGQKRRSTEIIAENMIILDRSGDAGSSVPHNAFTNSESKTVPIDDPTGDISLDEIPF